MARLCTQLLLFELAAGGPSVPWAASKVDGARPMRTDGAVPLLSLRGGSRQSRGNSAAEDMRVQAYEWTVNIATPAALVSGAALASAFEMLPEILTSLMDEKPFSWIRTLASTLEPRTLWCRHTHVAFFDASIPMQQRLAMGFAPCC